jgi:hypothetical protein
LIEVHSFSHPLVPVPFDKSTGTPQAPNGQDMHSENNSKFDRRTLKVIWQPLKVIFWSYYHVLIIYICSFSHLLMPVPLKCTPRARNEQDMHSENDHHAVGQTLFKGHMAAFKGHFGHIIMF